MIGALALPLVPSSEALPRDSTAGGSMPSVRPSSVGLKVGPDVIPTRDDTVDSLVARLSASSFLEDSHVQMSGSLKRRARGRGGDRGLDEQGCLTRWRIVLVEKAQKGPAGTGRVEWSFLVVNKPVNLGRAVKKPDTMVASELLRSAPLSPIRRSAPLSPISAPQEISSP